MQASMEGRRTTRTEDTPAGALRAQSGTGALRPPGQAGTRALPLGPRLWTKVAGVTKACLEAPTHTRPCTDAPNWRPAKAQHRHTGGVATNVLEWRRAREAPVCTQRGWQQLPLPASSRSMYTQPSVASQGSFSLGWRQGQQAVKYRLERGRRQLAKQACAAVCCLPGLSFLSLPSGCGQHT